MLRMIWWLVVVWLCAGVSAGCELPDPSALLVDSSLVSVGFEFWYAVGVEEPDILEKGTTLFDLEQLIYTSIDTMALWCRDIASNSTIEELGESQGGSQRYLEESIPSVSSSKHDFARKLGVVTFTPGRSDEVVTDGKFRLAFSRSQ